MTTLSRHALLLCICLTAPVEDGQCLLTQVAFFAPKGLLGWLYWYALYPLHRPIFSGMIDRLVAASAQS